MSRVILNGPGSVSKKKEGRRVFGSITAFHKKTIEVLELYLLETVAESCTRGAGSGTT